MTPSPTREREEREADLVHVKSGPRWNLPVCGFDPKDAPMAWTTFSSARVMATCAECLAEVLCDDCSVCNGNGRWTEWGEEIRCPHCSFEVAQELIDKRRTP